MKIFFPKQIGIYIEKTRKKAAGVTYTITSIIEAVDSTTLRITELPICCWTQDYEEFLEPLDPHNKNLNKETISVVFI
jgi:DNA topoisomerase-2